MGSLLSALASYLDAKHQHGQWFVRIEDLDPPREQTGAASNILQTLEQHGLLWDGDVLYQSSRLGAYEDALKQLREKGLLFPCQCTRAQLSPANMIHQGRCANTHPKGTPAWRLAVTEEHREFCDRLYGIQSQNLLADAGDITLKRKDGLFAYQLAVVVDDAFQGITDIVRGQDLLDSTLRQIYLQQCLGLPTPRYCHLPLLTYPNGQKLSKQNKAPAIDNTHARQNLLTALSYLNQSAPPQEQRSSCQDILNWAKEHWQLSAIKPQAIIIEKSPPSAEPEQ
jgi:glutamyl-Q tRNA(Asp) synthetase